MQIKRHLLATSDERTWKVDRPVLFLGEWCRLYKRSSTWAGIDAKVAAPFGLESGEKSHNIDYVQDLYVQLLIELTAQLNIVHNKNHSERYWNILIGHWLKRYVGVCFNRYFTIEQALKNYKITGATLFDPENYSLAAADSSSAIWACNDDVWNSMFYARIFQHMDLDNIKLELVCIEHNGFFEQTLGSSSANPFNIKTIISAISTSVLPKLRKNNDALIVNSYLPLWQEIKLQLKFWQCPQIWQSPPINRVSLDLNIRRNFSIEAKGHTGFQQFVRDLLPDMIPACYLEGFISLNQQAQSLPWPNKPKFIFTSNNFDTDEIFKAWTGLKVEQGVPYFTGQHGNYQAFPWLLNSPEVVSCDKFFTWGWTIGSTKTIPAFVFKLAQRSIKEKSKSGLLLIELSPPLQMRLYDAYYEYGIYQEQQFRFVEALPKIIQQELTVRLSTGWRNYRWSDEDRWRDRIPAVHIETGEVHIKTLLATNSLVVHSYDSTGILEGLAANTPTLCFWDGGIEHLMPSVQPYYELLREVGILADSPEHAAQLVTKYWGKVDEWWESQPVQSAREKFCNEYARIEKNPVATLKSLLTTAVRSKSND